MSRTMQHVKRNSLVPSLEAAHFLGSPWQLQWMHHRATAMFRVSIHSKVSSRKTLKDEALALQAHNSLACRQDELVQMCAAHPPCRHHPCPPLNLTAPRSSFYQSGHSGHTHPSRLLEGNFKTMFSLNLRRATSQTRAGSCSWLSPPSSILKLFWLLHCTF